MFVGIFSCVKKKQNTAQKQDSKPLLSIVHENGVVEKINPAFIKEVEGWKELKALDNFVLRFKKVSPNEVLSNALELESLVKSLKDSVKPPIFNVPSLNARINILYNETLRLSDMTFIPAIKATEVNVQAEKIISAFSGINAKVNSVLSKERFEKDIHVDVNYIGLDSTKMEGNSKDLKQKKGAKGLRTKSFKRQK